MIHSTKKKIIDSFVYNNIFFKATEKDKIVLCKSGIIKDSFSNLAYFCKNRVDVNNAIKYFNKKNIAPAFYADSAKLCNIAECLGFTEVANQHWWVNSKLGLLKDKFDRVDLTDYSLVGVDKNNLDELLKINTLEYYATGNASEEIDANQYTEVLKNAFEENKNLKLFLFSKNEKPFGIATLYVGKDFVHIYNIIFLNEYKRTGSFKGLKLLLDWIVANDKKRIVVITENSSYLDGIYKKLSFKKFYNGKIYSRKPQ